MSGARDGVATAWLDRPDRGNALSARAVEALLMASVAAALADPAVHTLVLRGRGRHFCTGFDLSGLETRNGRDAARALRARSSAAAGGVARAGSHRRDRDGPRVGRGRGPLRLLRRPRLRARRHASAFPGSAFGIVLGTRRLVELIGWDRARALVTEGATLDAAAAKAATLATDIVDGDGEAFLAERGAPPVADRRTFAMIRAATRPDRREEDMGTLDASASVPGLVQRIDRYRSSLRK